MASPIARHLPRFRHRLLARRRETLTQVAKTEREIRSLGANVEPELEDEAQEETATLLLTRLDERGRTTVAAIDQALARIASGTYGQCGTCGGAIAVGRLDALPEAMTCIACANDDARPARDTR